MDDAELAAMTSPIVVDAALTTVPKTAMASNIVTAIVAKATVRIDLLFGEFSLFFGDGDDDDDENGNGIRNGANARVTVVARAMLTPFWRGHRSILEFIPGRVMVGYAFAV